MRLASHMILVESSSLSFFSNERVNTLTKKIGTDILGEMVEKLENVIMRRVCVQRDSSRTMLDSKQTSAIERVTTDEARAYIDGQYTLAPGYCRQLM